MEMQLSGIYIARKVNLGSGPRERASSCCCDYRTSSPNRLNSSYTALEPDPPMVSCERQSYRRISNGSFGPLVKALNRESCQVSNGRMQRRTSSAKPRIQTEYLQVTEQPRIGNFMLVQGRTIACQERPTLQKRFSDDQIIKSVQDATTKQLSKLSLHLFGEAACTSPNAPCPSPEPCEKNYEITESMFGSECPAFDDNRLSPCGSSDIRIDTRNSNQDKDQWEFTVDGSSMDANIYEEECSERIEDMVQTDIEGHQLVEENAAPSKDAQKLFVKFSLPAETDEVNKAPIVTPQSEDTKFPNVADNDDKDCHKHDTEMEDQIKESIAKEKRKCFSASDSLGFIIKSKNVADNDDKDCQKHDTEMEDQIKERITKEKRKCFSASDSLSFIIKSKNVADNDDKDCHKHDTEMEDQIKERITKEKRKCFSASDSLSFIIKSKNVADNDDKDCHKHDTEMEDQIKESIAKEKRKCFSASDSLGFIIKSKNVEFLSEEDICRAKLYVAQNGLEKFLSMDLVVKDGKISRDSSNNIDLGVGEIAILKKNAIPTKEKKRTDMPSGAQVTSKLPLPTKELGDGSGAQAVVKTPNKDARSGSFTITENGRYTKANLGSNKRKVEKSSRNRNHHKGRSAGETKPQLIWRAVSGIDQLKKNNLVATGTQEKLTEKEIDSAVAPPSQPPKIEIKENSSSSLIRSTEVCSRPATAVKSCIINGIFTSKNRESTHQADRTTRKIRFTEPSDERKLTRPTSAVIQRYLEKASGDKTKSPDRKATRLVKRPMSSDHVSLNRRKQVHLKTRPKSANSPRPFYEGSRSVESRVVASQPLQIMPTSKQIPLARTQESKHRMQRKGSADIAGRAVAHTPPQRPKTAPVKNFAKAGKEVTALGEVRQEQEVSEECHRIWKSCQKKGVILSMETLRRALMPPTEFARPYNRYNLPHSSRMLRNAYE